MGTKGGAALLAGFLLLQAPASAHEIGGRVAAEYRDDVFSGRIRFSNDRCERRRFVQVVSPGGHVWGTDTTDRRGRWRAEVQDPPPAKYTVLVAEKQIRGGPDHRHVCSDVSATVKV